MHPHPKPVPLNDVLITEALSKRAPRPADLQAKNQAMRSLVRQMVNAPEIMMQSVVEMAVELCQAGTVGVSLLDTINGEEAFRWNVVAGTLTHLSSPAPRYSPCGICLDRGSPVLFSVDLQK